MGTLESLAALDYYLAQPRVFFFQSNLQSLGFQYCFSFPGADCWASLVNFSRLSFEGTSPQTMTEVWLLVPLRAVQLWGVPKS